MVTETDILGNIGQVGIPEILQIIAADSCGFVRALLGNRWSRHTSRLTTWVPGCFDGDIEGAVTE